MKGLLFKDFYLMKKYCRLFLLLIVVFAFVGVWNDNFFYAIYPITVSSMIPVNLLSYDEKSHWSIYACTLPYTRKDVVSSKYLLTLCTVIFSCLIVLLAQISNMFIHHTFQLYGLFSNFLLILVSGLLAPAFIFPFTFKLGSEKGRFAYYIGFILLFAILGSFQFLNDNLSLATFNYTKFPILISFLIVLLLYGFSWNLSINFYQNREL